MAFSQVVSVTTSAQTITLEGSARWLEFRPIDTATGETITVNTNKNTAGVPTAAVSEANDTEVFAQDAASIIRIGANGLPVFSIIASAACKVFVRGIDI